MQYNKFLALINGLKTVVTAIFTSGGVADAYKIISTGSDGRIDSSLLPPGVAVQVKTYVTSENLTAGNYVNIYDDNGTPTARQADALLGLPANGYVLASTTAPASTLVYTSGRNTQESGKTPGAVVFLGANGASSETPVAETSGYINQILGYALDADEVVFEYDDYVLFP